MTFSPSEASLLALTPNAPILADHRDEHEEVDDERAETISSCSRSNHARRARGSRADSE